MKNLNQVKKSKEAVACRERYHKINGNLKIKKIIVGDGETRSRYVLAFNPKEAKKQKQDRENIIKDIKERLQSLRQLPDEKHTKPI